MNTNIKKQLKKMRVSPLSRQEKEAVWKQIALGIAVAPKTVSRAPRRFSLLKKSIAMTLIFGMTSGTALAADGAKPGDFLFPLDRAMENAHLSVVSGEKKDELKVKFALERVEEVREIFSEISQTQTQTVIKGSLQQGPETKTEDTSAQDNVHIDESEDIVTEETTETQQDTETVELDMSTTEEGDNDTGDTETPHEEDTIDGSKTETDDNEQQKEDGADPEIGDDTQDSTTDTDDDTQINDPSAETGAETKDPEETTTEEVSELKSVNENIEEMTDILTEDVLMSDADKKRIELALGTALNFLSDVKGELAEQGNDEAASSIDRLLEDLNNEIGSLPENVTFEIKLSPSKQKVQFEITSEDDKDVVRIVETPVIEDNVDLDTSDNETDKPKETKLEIKNGALTITADDVDDPAVGEEETKESAVTGSDEETAEKLPDEPEGKTGDDPTKDEVEEDGKEEGSLEDEQKEKSEETDPPTGEDTEKKEEPLSEQPTETENAVEEISGTINDPDEISKDDKDETTTVKVIIKKLDADFELSVTDEDGGLHDVINEYMNEKEGV